MDLNNIVGFKAVDKNGNERQVTVDEMTELVSARIVSAASEISTFAAAAAAGTDEFEDQLPQSDTFSWLRTLDGSKNPTLTSSSAAAKVLGELMNSLNLFPFCYNTNIYNKTENEINNLVTGLYDIFEGNEALGGMSIDWSNLVVFKGKYQTMQIIFKENIYMRSYKEAWSEWIQI